GLPAVSRLGTASTRRDNQGTVRARFIGGSHVDRDLTEVSCDMTDTAVHLQHHRER
ncbi:hypothetical protein BaRGS_00035829, partial [Batillaria attramentaria]